MRYFHVTNGEIDEGPRDLPQSWRNVSGLHLMTTLGLAAIGWLPESVEGYEPFNPETQNRAGPVYTVEANRVVSTYTVADKPLDEAKAARKAALSLKRKAVEIAGINFGGAHVTTDDIDQSKVTGASVSADKGYISLPLEWKTGSGFVQLDAPTISALSAAVAQHVEGCFAREKALSDEIDACQTVAEVAAVDFDAGWS